MKEGGIEALRVLASPITRLQRLLALLVCGFAAGASFAQPSPQDEAAGGKGQRAVANDQRKRADLDDVSTRIIKSTNAFRLREKLSALERDPSLRKAASYFAGYLARTDKFSHDADGNAPAARAKKFGYAYCLVAENIAFQFSTAGFSTSELADRLFEGWQTSPGHRKNMLDPGVTETAVAIARSDQTGNFYAVQMFGRPQSESVEFSIVNQAGEAVEYSLDGQTFALPPGVTRSHQRCRPSELIFKGKVFHPVNGQQLLVESGQGRAVLKVK